VSSRIRRGSSEPVAAMAWVQVESPAAHADSLAAAAMPSRPYPKPGLRAPDDQASPSNIDDPLAAVRQQMESEIALAREQGRVEGQAAAAAEAQASLVPSLQAFQVLLRELASEKSRARKSAETDVVQLAIAIAKRVVHRELATDPEAILGLVKSAWDKVNARETQKLRVSVADAALLEAQRPVLGFPAGLSIIPDGALAQGSMVFETARGQLDASVDTQLVEIERGLTDLLQRRTK
jgi:flagellar assembly protein FliH